MGVIVEGFVDGVGLGSGIVREDFGDQRAVVGNDHTRLLQADQGCLAPGRAERPGRIDGDIGVIALADCRDRGGGGTDL